MSPPLPAPDPRAAVPGAHGVPHGGATDPLAAEPVLPEEVARAKAIADAVPAARVSTPKLGNVQALRAIAVLAVVAAHVGGPNGLEPRYLDGDPLFGWVFRPAQAAVDLFFVISGLIMTITTWNLVRGPEAARRFIVRRLKRIYPIYWVPTSLVLVLFLVRPELVNSSSEHPPQVLPSFLLLPQPGLPLLSVGWTLMFELYFYIVFAAALLAPRRWMPWILGGWGALTLGLRVALPETSVPALQVMSNPLLMEFLLGVVVGYLVMTRPPIAPAAMLGGGLVLMAIGLYFATTVNGLLDTGYRTLAIAPPAAMIVLGAIGIERQRRYVVPRFLQYFGDASYSIYLWHTLLLVAAGRAIAWLLPDTSGPLHVVLVIAVPVAVVAATVVLYELIERPLLAALSRPPAAAPRDAPAPTG